MNHNIQPMNIPKMQEQKRVDKHHTGQVAQRKVEYHGSRGIELERVLNTSEESKVELNEE